jgi:hypothetical protein
MRAFPAILLSQLDAMPFDPVHSADVDAVSADDFHMLLDFAHVRHR